MLNDDIFRAASLYVSDRQLFTQEYGFTAHKDYLDMLFIGANTRPELSETIAVLIAGYTPCNDKHGIDGLPSERRSGYGEFKITTTDTFRNGKYSVGSITINDPSMNIIQKYDQLGSRLDFVFPLFIDGHLISMFSVPWANLRETYVNGITSINEKNRRKQLGESAARNFTLSATTWLPDATVEFIHQDTNLVHSLMSQVKILKKYRERILDESLNSPPFPLDIHKSLLYNIAKSTQEDNIMGGNVFAGQTSPIERDNIVPTLERYFAELKRLFPAKAEIFNLQHFQTLGSAGRKAVSGDIDIGIDQQYVTADSGWNIPSEDLEEEFLRLKKRARTATEQHLRQKALLRKIVEYINLHSELIHCDLTKTSSGNMYGFFPQYDAHGNSLDINVQIDWMVGDIDWIKFSCYSSEYLAESNVKGLHRTQLMLSAFQVADLSFNHTGGVKSKITGDIVASKPIEALQILNNRLNTTLSMSDVENYYALHDKLKKELSTEQYAHLVNCYLKILDSTRADIPDDLHTVWRAKKSDLKLTGKFLPENSKLLQE